MYCIHVMLVAKATVVVEVSYPVEVIVQSVAKDRMYFQLRDKTRHRPRRLKNELKCAHWLTSPYLELWSERLFKVRDHSSEYLFSLLDMLSDMFFLRKLSFFPEIIPLRPVISASTGPIFTARRYAKLHSLGGGRHCYAHGLHARLCQTFLV